MRGLAGISQTFIFFPPSQSFVTRGGFGDYLRGVYNLLYRHGGVRQRFETTTVGTKS